MQSLQVNIQLGSNQGTLDGQQGQHSLAKEFDKAINTNFDSIGVPNMNKVLL
jgi:hypothetical protein